MCGRFFIAEEDPNEELQFLIEMMNRRKLGDVPVKTGGEVFPTDTVPVVANSRGMERAVFPMRWGYGRKDGHVLINARSETAAEKPLFRDDMLQRRCLIPASHYFEWERRGKEKVKYAIRTAGSSVIYMAGIYRIREGRPEFVILTREPAASIAFIHDRMPVLLPGAAREAWLDLRCDPHAVLRSAVQDIAYMPA